MHTLIITAHPSSKGFTHRIAAAFSRGRTETGHTVEILDLYKTDLKQDYLNFENIREIPVDPIRVALQAKITGADEIVLVHPLWWMGPPAIMKNFLDNNLMARFAYRYLEGGKRVGLLKGKKAKVFITCDGPLYIYLLLAMPFWTIWFFGVLTFCGMKVTSFKLFDQKMKRSEAECDAFLKKVEKIARKA